MSFIAENAGTIGTALVVASVLFLIVRKIIRDAKSGKPLCGGDCGGSCSCSCGSTCHHGSSDSTECPAMQSVVEKIKGN